MTAPLSAAESFLTLLDDLAGAKPNTATAAVLLQHAATHIRELLVAAADMRDLVAELADAEPAPCSGCGAQMEFAPVLGHRPGCDVPRPGQDAEGVVTPSITGPGRKSEMCGARGDSGDLFCMLAPDHRGDHVDIAESGTIAWPRPGSVSERLPAANEGRPGPGRTAADAANEFNAGLGVGPPRFGQPGLPDLARHPDLECGAADGPWLCNAAQGHAPLDHVTVVRGVVLHRWPSVQAVADCPDDLTQVGDISQAEHDEAVAHLLTKYGTVPSSLQQVIDMGGRIKRMPRPDVRREGMGAQGEPATGVVAPGANTIPPRTGVPRPEHGDGRVPEPSALAAMADGTGPGHTEPPLGGTLREGIAGQPLQQEPAGGASPSDALPVPPNSQVRPRPGERQAGYHPQDVPRPGGLMEVPEVRETDVPVQAVTPSAGPGHLNGHALRPPGPIQCCDLHGRNCEPPSELCCEECTEQHHPRHADGSACSAPDLSAEPFRDDPLEREPG